jgi:hypothetical protein
MQQKYRFGAYTPEPKDHGKIYWRTTRTCSFHISDVFERGRSAANVTRIRIMVYDSRMQDAPEATYALIVNT